MSDGAPRRRRDPAEITDALRSVGDDFVRRNPGDIRMLRQSIAKARRKRRLYFSGGLVAATAAIALLFVVVAPGIEDGGTEVAEQPTTPQSLRVTQRIALDGQPYQIASNSQGAYVTLRDEGTVLKIGSESGEVDWMTEIGGAPEDIIAGEFAVWVTEPEGRLIHSLTFRKGLATQSPIRVTRGIPERLSVGSTAVRITTQDGPAYRIDYDGRDGQQLGEDTAWDIAYLGGRLWVLTPEGLVYPVDGESGEAIGDVAPVQVFEPGEFEDALSAGEITAAQGAIWYGRPGSDTLIRIDAGDASSTEIPLPDGYADLDGDNQGSVWILVRSGETGELIEVDNQTGELLPRSISLPEEPLDIAASGDGVWIVLAGTQEVIHVNDAAQGTL